MLMLNQVSDEFFACFRVELIGWIGHTGTIGNELLCIVDSKLCKFCCGLTVGYQFNIHLSFSNSLSVSG